MTHEVIKISKTAISTTPVTNSGVGLVRYFRARDSKHGAELEH